MTTILWLGPCKLGMALAAHGRAAGAGDDNPAVEPLDDAAFWKAIPKSIAGGGGLAPVWARAAALELPRTAAAMLVLDRAEREVGTLDPRLRAKLRWEIAHANRCSYMEPGTAKGGGDSWRLCRGLHLTRVSDGFQLPLKRENVFAGPVPVIKPKRPQVAPARKEP